MRALFGVAVFAVCSACAGNRPGPEDAGGGFDAGADGGDPSDAGSTDAGFDPGDGGFEWPVPTSPISITPHGSWKNRLQLPAEAFANSTGELRWVKFTVLMRDPSKVYFQDSNRYPLHAPFAIERLDPFFNMTVPRFERVSLHAAGQEAITGAVLVPPGATELGIQLVRMDPYAKQMVKIVFDLVRGSIDSQVPVDAFYMPTFEQAASTLQNRPWLESHGVPVSSPDRWISGTACYSRGWALGRLKRFAAPEIDAAYADGRLTVHDILVIDSVPAELPPLSGIISLAPATPNSHVAILAATLGIPFLHVFQPADLARLQMLEGRDVVLRAGSRWGSGCDFDVFSADTVPQTVRDQLLLLKTPKPLQLPPKQHRGAWSANADVLRPADIVHFGGKAAHYGDLRRGVPNNSYPAVGLSFDVWDDVMAQPVTGGRTLRQEIDARLAPISSWPVTNLAVLKQTLAGVRTLIVDQARLSASAEAGVRSALSGFDAQKNLRFRSSTNVEDTDAFTGAGLYDSFTGCLADDNDADALGPSICSPTRPTERGAFLALRRVFASFYNDNAYLERIRHRVVESQVGMAVLVHPSVPDSDELANGVATLSSSFGTYYQANVVTQLGADSVTNPTGLSRPEVVEGGSFGSMWAFDLRSSSSLVPLGSWVMNSPADYAALGTLLGQVAAVWASRVQPPFSLDFEFKKQAPGKIWLKQVRPLPLPDSTPSVTPFVLNRPGAALCISQGESSDVIALHRLRMRVRPTMRDVELTPAARAQSVFASASVELFDGDSLLTMSGAPASWAGFAHSAMGESLTDTFAFGTGPLAGTRQLSVSIPMLVRPIDPPMVTARELAFTVAAHWAQPQPQLARHGAPNTTQDDYANLGSCPEDEVITVAHARQQRTFMGAGLTVRASYFWPPVPTGISAGYTAPNVKWESTEIVGLTTAPLRLTDQFAQTYRPQHHNFSEDFVFDPFRDPGTTGAQKSELQARNVRWLIVLGTPAQPEFHALGFDNVIRPLP